MRKIHQQMVQHQSSKLMWKKYTIILFCFALILSPFSSLGAIYADDEQTDDELKNDTEELEVLAAEDGDEEASDPDDEVNDNDEPSDENQSSEEQHSEGSGNDADTPADDDSSTDGNNSSEGDDDSTKKDGASSFGAAATFSGIKKQADDDDELYVAASGIEPMAAGGDYQVSDNGDGTVTITGYTGSDTDIIIPDTLDGKTVTTIGQSAFSGKELTSVVIPDSVTTIKIWAFQNNKLKDVTISNNLSHIEAQVFANNQIENVTIPNSVTTIDGRAFFNNNLKSITIPDSVTSFGINPFGGNPDIKFEVVGNKFETGENNNYLKEENYLIAGNHTGEIPNNVTTIGSQAFINNELENIVIPDHVTTINDSAFFNNKLTNISIPNSVTRIHSYAFYNNNLTNVTFPNSVTGVGQSAFVNNDLEKVIVNNSETSFSIHVFDNNQANPANLTIIGHDSSTAQTYAENNNHTFQSFSHDYEWTVNADETTVTITNYKGNATDITIPDTLDGKTVTVIGEDAFRNKGLNSVVIPNTVTSLGYRAFLGNNLVNLTIPEGVKTLASFVFSDNDLKSVEIPASLTSMDRNPFSGNPEIKFTVNGNTFETGANGNYLRHEDTLISGNNTGEIPNDVTEIGNQSFFGADLVNITIPGSVEIIGQEALARNSITNVSIPNNVTTIRNAAFRYNDLTSLTIPENVEIIAAWAFNHNNLTQVSIYNSQTILGDNVFGINQTNPADLTIEGYVNSTAEIDANNYGYTFIPFSEIVVDDNALPVKSNMTVTVKNASNDEIATLKIPDTVEPNDALDDATLEVKSVNPVIATGLAEAGAVLDFIFRDASGDEIKVSGDFELSLLVDDATNEIAIYHEVDQDDWTNIGGTVTNNFITANVNDFSAYGVFYEIAVELEIDSIETLTDISVDYGTALNDVSLPEKVEVTLNDGTTQIVDVNWDNGNPAYNGTQPRNYEFTGTPVLPTGVTNPNNLTATVTVEVGELSIADVETLASINVTNGTVINDVPLPEDVEVTLSDGNKQNIQVDWDNGTPAYDGTKSGVYVFAGTLNLPADVTNPDNLVASVTVIVGELSVTEIPTLANIEVDYGTDLNDIGLPEELEVTLNNGIKLMIKVNWDGGNPAYDGTQSGNYDFTGTLDLPDGVTNPNSLQAAITVIVDDEPVPVVDKDALKTLIDQADGLDEDDFTPESFKDLVAALTAARGVFEDDEATQDDVDDAVDELQGAIVGLEKAQEPDPDQEDPIVDKDKLKTLIDEAEGLNEDDYTEETFAAMTAALEQAKAVIDDDDATENEVSDAYTLLNESMNALTKVEDPNGREEPLDPEEDPEEDPEKDQNGRGGPGDPSTDPKDESDDELIVTIEDGDDTDKSIVSGQLPKTATPYYTMMFIGGLLILIGGVWFTMKRKRQNVFKE